MGRLYEDQQQAYLCIYIVLVESLYYGKIHQRTYTEGSTLLIISITAIV